MGLPQSNSERVQLILELWHNTPGSSCSLSDLIEFCQRNKISPGKESEGRVMSRKQVANAVTALERRKAVTCFLKKGAKHYYIPKDDWQYRNKHPKAREW